MRLALLEVCFQRTTRKMLIGRHLAVALVRYPSLLLFSSSAGQHKRYKCTLAVALDFTASATANGPRSRAPVAALAIALGRLPRAAAKPTSLLPPAPARAPPLPSLTLTRSHQIESLSRPPIRPPPPRPTPAALPGAGPPPLPAAPATAILPRRSPPTRAGPPPPRGTPPSFLLLPPSLVIVIRE